jgi:DNA-binding protein YbaB
MPTIPACQQLVSWLARRADDAARRSYCAAMDLNALAEHAQRQVDRIAHMQADLAEATATAASHSGRVSARTGPGGAVLGLRIEPTAMRLSPEELAAEVTEAITSAQRSYGSLADEIMAPVLGIRSTMSRPTAGYMVDEAERRQ